MKNNKLTSDQLRALVQYASNKLGVTPEQLSKTIEGDQAQQLASQISQADMSKFQALVGDKDKLDKILESPKAQKMIEKLFEK
ncbi:MAG: hypothetical protein PHX02_04645 [Oscillospiraceae bacterium]|nr:hypothetical protein [Oscillospiraceae bacterium]